MPNLEVLVRPAHTESSPNKSLWKLMVGTQNPFEFPNILEAHTDTSRSTFSLLIRVSHRSPEWLYYRWLTQIPKALGRAPDSHTELARCSPLETLNTQPVPVV